MREYEISFSIDNWQPDNSDLEISGITFTILTGLIWQPMDYDGC
jgi:hypothetical protein